MSPPTPVGIDTTHHLLADASLALAADTASPSATPLQTAAQGLLDYAQTITDTGDELMFTMDIPYVPMQETPIVLAQAATSGTTPALHPDYLLNVCEQTESTGDPMSAMRGVDPAYMLKNYIQNQVHHYVDIAGITNISLLEGTTHGKITSGTTNYGRTAFGYDPEPSYVGNDKAVFMADFDGKHYKITVELHVFVMVDEKLPTTCPPPQLIKVNGKPVSGSSDFNLNPISLVSG